MASQRINSRELTADHIGRTVSVLWPTAAGAAGIVPSVTGELESVTQHRNGAGAQLSVGPLSFSVELGGPTEIHLYGEE